MKKTLLVVLALTISVLSFAEMQLKNVIIVPKPSELEVKVWLNKPEGAVYQVNESLNIYFKANKSCYVLIYDIRTDGKITLLFPNKYDSNNYIAPNVNYKLPISNLYSFKVSPPEGKEYIQIIASTSFIPIIQQLKNLGTTQSFPILSEDAENYVQKQIIPYLSGEWASDITYFYVGRGARTGIAQLESNPTGAYVYVDGKYIGRTPARVELDEGQHFATFYWQNEVDTETFFITAGQTVVVTGNFVRKSMLDIRTNPSSAQIFLDGNYVGVSPIQVEVQPGQHTVLATKAGYAPAQQSFTISPGETRTITLNLNPEQATLNIFTVPSGASIYVNNQYRGIAPSSGLSLNVAPGTYTITARLTNYQDASFTVTVDPGEVRRIDLTLIPIVRKGTLNIFTNPTGATIYVDGNYVGVSRTGGLSVQVDPGVHTIIAQLADYQESSISVNISSGETRRVDITLIPVVKKGVVRVYTNPVGATVYVNGNSWGQAPSGGMSIELDANVLYRISASMPDYEDATVDVQVAPNETKTITLTLQPIQKTGTVSINTSPSNALVYVNGYLKGVTPLKIDLDYGTYQLVLIKGGYYAELITLKVDRKNVSVNTTLKPIQ
ncbi:PEGA domain-containing protein [Thermotoga profunda]|uniref:PEGA domain-containing protein n=1 Tax=Thermotoga profunda TaxID=1508420 RepID=UPI000694EB88|nr:PEGA domain-containing protein [Thermotoga profunda]